MKSKSSIAILLALALLFAAGLLPPASPAGAQSDAPTIQATPAFDGYFKYGEWVPIWVELENQGGDVDGEVQVRVTGSQGTIVFSAPASLPSGSRKRVPVYVLPNNFSREVTVQFVSDGEGLVSQKVTVRPQPNISYFAGLILPERGATALLTGVKLPGQERPKILVDIPLAELPERAEALRSFDLLVLNDTDTSRLTPGQADALAGWVQQGGRLVIGGGAGAQATLSGLPENLLPVQFNSTVEISTEEVQPLALLAGSEDLLVEGPFVAARVDASGSQILAGDSQLPLVVERAFGSGAVNFVALDLAGVPFNGWPGTQAFWEKLIGPGGGYPENMPFDMSPRQFRANSLMYALSNIPSLDLPSVKGLSILLCIYILIVGPVNYLFLRWRKRLHLAWVTIPVLTALFTAGSFGIGYALRGNDLVLNKIALVQTRPDGDAAVTSYMGLFSPRQQSYEVTVHGEGLLSPMTGYDQGPWGNPALQATGGEMVFVQGQPSRVNGLTVNQWAMQSFMSEDTWPEFGQLTGDLRIENEKLVGTVRNDTGYPLTDVVIAMQSRFAKLGDLDPGEEALVDLGLSNLQADRFGTPLSYRLFQEQQMGGPMPRAIELKMNIISSVFENGPMMKISSSRIAFGTGSYNGIIVFGWLNQAPPDVEVGDNGLSQQVTALVYSTPDFNLPESGFLALPPGMVSGVVSKMPQEGGTCGANTSVHMARGQAEFEFQVPANLPNLRVDTLKLALWRDNSSPWNMPEISLYRWDDETWTIIQEPIQGTNVIQNASPYVNESGVVRVRLSSESDTFGCIYLDMGLEAELSGGARQNGQGG